MQQSVNTYLENRKGSLIRVAEPSKELSELLKGKEQEAIDKVNTKYLGQEYNEDLLYEKGRNKNKHEGEKRAYNCSEAVRSIVNEVIQEPGGVGPRQLDVSAPKLLENGSWENKNFNSHHGLPKDQELPGGVLGVSPIDGVARGNYDITARVESKKENKENFGA